MCRDVYSLPFRWHVASTEDMSFPFPYPIPWIQTHTHTHTSVQEGTATPTTTSSEEDGTASTVPSLSPPPPPPPAVELNMAPPLEKQFKKPPPMGNRRKPTKQYLQEKRGEEVTDLDGETVCVYVCCVHRHNAHVLSVHTSKRLLFYPQSGWLD